MKKIQKLGLISLITILIVSTNGYTISAKEYYNGWRNDKGTWYLYKNNVKTKGWYENEEGWHYFDKEGKLLKGWQTINGKFYYIDSRGIITKGWYQNNEGWHYFNDQGHMLTGWQTINGKVYYINSRGIITKGWYENEEGWHYFNDQGHMVTGWYNIKGKFYYINSRGIITKGWYLNNDGWHYFNSQGHMVTGWQTVNGKKYYFNSNGIITTGWFTLGASKYYFNDQGHMAIGWANINGSNYYFNNDGVWVEYYSDVPYYSQLDSRWKNTYFGNYTMGASGCLPTSIAMAATYLKKTQVLPIDVARYLYNSTTTFNKEGAGASGDAVSASLRYLGLKCEGNLSKEEVAQSLREGKIIIATQNPGQFTKPGYTHCIVLKGIDSNNYVYVNDPYYTSNNRYFPLDLVYSQRSTDPYDLKGGGPYWSVSLN